MGELYLLVLILLILLGYIIWEITAPRKSFIICPDCNNRYIYEEDGCCRHCRLEILESKQDDDVML